MPFEDKCKEEETLLTTILKKTDPKPREARKEGDLYKTVTTFGKTFELRYGYYSERDRQNPICEPAVIYPDFTREPLYTDDGMPLVTVIQDACGSYRGEAKRTPDTTCAECKFLQRGEDWFGICKSPMNRKANGDI